MTEFAREPVGPQDETQPLRRPEPASGTEVMSLDDLLEVAAESAAPTPPAANDLHRPAAPYPAEPTAGRVPPFPPVTRPPGPQEPRARRDRPAAARPAAARPAAVRPAAVLGNTWRRLQQDGVAAGSGALRTANAWLDTGDNALIVATTTLALFLLLAIGLL